MIDIYPPHRAHSRGSTSYTFFIISAQPLEGLNEASSSMIGGWEGSEISADGFMACDNFTPILIIRVDS